MTDTGGLERLTRASAAVRARLAAALAGGLFGLVVVAILLLSVLPAPVREGRGSLAPLVVLGAVVVTGAFLVSRGRRFGRRLDPDDLAAEADAAAGLGSGDVRGALELGRGGESGGALAAYHVRRVSERLAELTTDRLLPRTGPLWKRRAVSAALAAVVIVVGLTGSAVLRPRQTLSAAIALGTPWRTAFPAPLPPLEIAPASGVRRGEAAAVVLSAVGRTRVSFSWRAAGEPPRRVDVAIDAGGAGTGRTDPITSATSVWIEDDAGMSSDTIIIRPLEPLLVQDLQVRLEYPAYLNRAPDEHRGQVPPLVVPEGTTIRLAGEANLALTGGDLTGATDGAGPARPGEIALQIDGARFAAVFSPRSSGTWTWRLAGERSIGRPILPTPLRVLLVPDLAPRLALLFPAPDTLLGPDGIMPIVLDAEDDIGLRGVVLRSWRSGLGEDRAERTESLAPAPNGARRAAFRHLLDRGDEDLLPGDTIFYRFEGYDGHPTRGPAISDVFLLRVPTFTEIQADRADRSDVIADAARDLEDAVDALAEAAADAARRVEAEEGTDQAAFETTEEARAVLDDAERAAEGLSDLEEELAALHEDVTESALSDEALAQELEALAERYQELMDAGLRERIDELAAALQDLDPEAVREALEQLSEDSDWLREQLEQTLGMLEQTALDQAVKSAQADAESLSEQQRDLAEGEVADPEEWVDEQERLAEQADELARALDELEQRLGESGQTSAADSAASAEARTGEAAESMREAAGRMSESPPGEQGEQARQEGRDAASEAAEAMEQASEALGSAQQNMSQQNREAATESLGRARSEALSLAEEEGRLAEATRGQESVDPETWRARQAAVRQGLENMLDQLSEAGNEAAMLDRGTGTAAADAADQMDALLQRLSEDGARRLPSRSEAEGIQTALNRLASQLLASEQAARAGEQQAQGEQAGEQMASLAQEQQGVTQETSSLLMPGPRPAGEEQRQREVARQQQEIADQLRDIQDPEGELLGRPEEMAEEAAELARQLEENGPTQETLERQRRLFRRMLDAGRSLEDEDLDENRRESETGRAAPRDIPDIDPALLQGRRFPLPSEDVLRGLPVFYRQLIFEYFDRLNRPPAAEGRGGGGGGR